MSDLTDLARDQRPLPSARIGPVNRPRRDRRARLSDLLLALTLAATACVRTPEPLPPSEVHRPEFWVDGFSAPGGDGSKEHPLRTVPQPLPPRSLVHLRTGVYAGALHLEGGVTLEGTGEVVLTGGDGAEVVVTARDAELVGLSLQGGATGLEAGAGVKATRVRFSGQRQRAARVRGSLTLTDVQLVASVEGIDGVMVERGATLEGIGVRAEGGFKRAVSTEGGTLKLRGIRGEGGKTLVHALDASSTLEDVRARGGTGSALFFAGGTLTLTGAEIEGHEYALHLAREATASVTGLQARGALLACVAANGATLALTASRLWQCGAGGALSLMNAHTRLDRVEVKDAQELGVLVRQGELELRGPISVARVSGSNGALGDGLHVREAKVRDLSGAHTFSGLEGSAVFASAFADVQLKEVSVERARSSAFFVERRALLRIGHALVRGGGGPALAVPDGARARIDALFVAGGNESPVFAECQSGAEVSIGRLETTVPQVPSRCVELER